MVCVPKIEPPDGGGCAFATFPAEDPAEEALPKMEPAPNDAAALLPPPFIAAAPNVGTVVGVEALLLAGPGVLALEAFEPNIPGAAGLLATAPNVNGVVLVVVALLPNVGTTGLVVAPDCCCCSWTGAAAFGAPDPAAATGLLDPNVKMPAAEAFVGCGAAATVPKIAPVPFGEVMAGALAPPKVNGDEPPVPAVLPATAAPKMEVGLLVAFVVGVLTTVPNMCPAFGCCVAEAKRFVLAVSVPGTLLLVVFGAADPNRVAAGAAPNMNGCDAVVPVLVALAFVTEVAGAGAGPTALPAMEPNVGNVVVGAMEDAALATTVGLAAFAPNVNVLAAGGVGFGVVVALPNVNVLAAAVVVVEEAPAVLVVNSDPEPNVGIVAAVVAAGLLAALKPKLKAGVAVAGDADGAVLPGSVLVGGCAVGEAVESVTVEGSLKPPKVVPAPKVAELMLAGDAVVVVAAAAAPTVVVEGEPPVKENIGVLLGTDAVAVDTGLPPNCSTGVGSFGAAGEKEIMFELLNAARGLLVAAAVDF